MYDLVAPMTEQEIMAMTQHSELLKNYGYHNQDAAMAQYPYQYSIHF